MADHKKGAKKARIEEDKKETEDKKAGQIYFLLNISFKNELHFNFLWNLKPVTQVLKGVVLLGRWPLSPVSQVNGAYLLNLLFRALSVLLVTFAFII